MTTAVPRWNPSLTISKREQMLLKRLEEHRQLFALLRQHRSELFDDAFCYRPLLKMLLRPFLRTLPDGNPAGARRWPSQSVSARAQL